MTLTNRRPIARRTKGRVRSAESLQSNWGLSRRLPRWCAFDGRQSRALRKYTTLGWTDAQDLMRMDSDKG
jgi:hypothetical protein